MLDLQYVSDSVADRNRAMWNMYIIVDQADTGIHVVNRHLHAACAILDPADRTAGGEVSDRHILAHQMLRQSCDIHFGTSLASMSGLVSLVRYS